MILILALSCTQVADPHPGCVLQITINQLAAKALEPLRQNILFSLFPSESMAIWEIYSPAQTIVISRKIRRRLASVQSPRDVIPQEICNSAYSVRAGSQRKCCLVHYTSPKRPVGALCRVNSSEQACLGFARATPVPQNSSLYKNTGILGVQRE